MQASFLKISILIFVSGLFISGCAGLNSSMAPQKFTIDKRWARSALTLNNPGFFKNHSAQPVAYKNKILVANAFDGLGLYKQGTGREIWKFYIKNGSESKPFVHNDIIYIGGNDGLFYSIRVKNGQLNWSFPIRFEGLGSPSVDDNFVYFTTGNHNLYALDIKTGRSKWIYTRKVDSSISVRGQGDILIDKENLYTGFSDGYFVAFKKNTGNIIWEKKLNTNRRFKDVDSSPVIHGDAIYVSGYDSNLYALDKTTGKILWQAPYGSHKEVLIVDDKVYSSTSSGKVVSLNKTTGKLLWEVSLKKGIGTAPTYYKGYLIVGESDGKILALSQLDGQVIGTYDTGAGVMAKITQVPGSKKFFVLSKGGNIFSFNIGLKKASNIWPWEN